MCYLYSMIAVTVISLLVGGPAILLAGSGNVAAGKRIYSELCKTCHGLDGKGTGVMNFTPPAADLTSRQVQAKLDSGLYNSIHEGRANTAMGAWKYALSEEEILNVLSYVRTFGSGSAQP
jgi:mono/diheme cytochrome c family protein